MSVSAGCGGSSNLALSPTRQLSVGCADDSGAKDALAPPIRLRVFAVQGPFSAMHNQHTANDTPRAPLCPSCAQIMRLARTTTRFGNLPDLHVFECRACGVTHIDPAQVEVA